MKRTEVRSNINLLATSLIGDKLSIKEEDTIRLVLEFLSRRELHLAQISLERESGINNCPFGDDLIFLRQLILDGQWNDVLQFVQPLEYFDSFAVDQFRFIIYKHKYIELLCIRSESSETSGNGIRFQTEIAIENIIDCLKHLERYAANSEEYSQLNALLTVPDLSQEDELRHFNPNQWRLKCFQEILPLVRVFLDVQEINNKNQANNNLTTTTTTTINDNEKLNKFSINDRLMKLIFKGLMYEVSLSVIQNKIHSISESISIKRKEIDVFNGCDFKFNLTGFLEQMSNELIKQYFLTGSMPEIKLDVTKHSKPDLMASWSEMILSAPIKPKVFPHNAVPYTRIKASDLMSKSLSASLTANNPNVRDLMVMSVADIAQFSRSTLASSGFRLQSDFNQSTTFHNKQQQQKHQQQHNDQADVDCKDELDNQLTLMTTSMNKLFQGSDVFSASTYLPTIVETNTPSTPERIFDHDSHMFQQLEQLHHQHCKLNYQFNLNEKSQMTDDHNKENNKEFKEMTSEIETKIILKPIYDDLETKNNFEQKDMNESYIDVWRKNKTNIHQENSDKIFQTKTNIPLRKVDSFRRNSRSNSIILDSETIKYHKRNDKSLKSTPTNVIISSVGSSFLNNNSNSHLLPKQKNNLIPIKTSTASTVHGAGHNSGSFSSTNTNPTVRSSSRASTSLSNAPKAIQQTAERSISRTSSVQSSKQSQHKKIDRSLSPLTSGVQETTATFDLLEDEQNSVKFVLTYQINDSEAIRTVDWHPRGEYFAVGSNSKLLRVFRISNSGNNQDRNNNLTADSLDSYSPSPEVIYRRPKYHNGSVYCLAWNKIGNLLATGSNDKTIKLASFDESTGKFVGCETTIAVHDGTIRDLCFMDDLTNGSSILLSAGAGNCRIYITDCETSQSFMSLSGHSRPIHALYTWGGATLASGSEDRTIRMWDLRSRDCYNLISCPTISRNSSGGAVTSIIVDPSGKLLVSGHEDSTCMLYDIRAGRVIQTFNPHTADVRSIRFSSKAYHLLTAGFDNRLVLSNLQGDLTQPIQSVEIARHEDRVISARWHPTDFMFLSASADKTAALWSLHDNFE